MSVLQSRLQQLFAGDEGEFDRRFGQVFDEQQRALQMLGQLRLSREAEAMPMDAGSGARGGDFGALGQSQGRRSGAAGQLVSDVDTAVGQRRDQELAQFIQARDAERARVADQIRRAAAGITELGVSQGMNLANVGVQAKRDKDRAARDDETIAMLRSLLGGG